MGYTCIRIGVDIMVLRKPYAFFIKHFKLIHILLTILMILFFVKIRDVVNFFNSYIEIGTYSQMSDVASKYIGLWEFILPIIVIVVIITIMSILHMKQKPIRYYLFAILVNVVEMIMLVISYTLLTQIQIGTIQPTFLQIFRDLFSSLSYVMIPFILISLVRGVGFNVKQFNFKKDLMELEIDERDNEEFEFEVDVDTDDLKAKFNRSLRFIKYAYLENKVVFYVVGVAFIIGLGVLIYSYFGSLEKTYKENQTFTAYYLDLQVKNSYKTTTSSNGSVIRNDKFYVVVELEAKNKYDVDLTIPYENIHVRVNEYTKFSPIDSYIDEFSEFGKRYISTGKVKASSTQQLILVFELDKKYENDELRLEYLVSTNSKRKNGIYDYAKIKIEPKNLKKIVNVNNAKLGDILKFDDSLIVGTEFKATEVEFNKRYTYKYKQKIGGVEREFSRSIIPKDTSLYFKTIMRIDADLVTNPDLYYKIYSNFYSKYVGIEYLDGKEMVRQKAKVIDLTPNIINSKYIYLEVLEDVSKSKKVNLVFTIRDREYKYTVIDKE